MAYNTKTSGNKTDFQGYLIIAIVIFVLLALFSGGGSSSSSSSSGSRYKNCKMCGKEISSSQYARTNGYCSSCASQLQWYLDHKND